MPSQKSHVSPTSDLTPDIINDTDVAALALLNIGSNEVVRVSSLEGENHEEEVADDPPSKNKGGRPKGSTNEAKSDALKRKKLAMNDAALKMKKLKEEAASAGKRVPRNAYTKILSDTSERYDLPDVLDYKSVESRLRAWKKGISCQSRSCLPYG